MDDDPAIVRIVGHMVATHLSELYRTVTFTDSRAARDWFEPSPMRCVDFGRRDAGIGGVDLLRDGKRQNADMQAIFLTAHSAWDRIAEAIEHGVKRLSAQAGRSGRAGRAAATANDAPCANARRASLKWTARLVPEGHRRTGGLKSVTCSVGDGIERMRLRFTT